jgi:Na+(H+)/acetate symporter ActP
MLLLCAYIALGATDRLTWRQAGRAALVLTVVVIAVVMVTYSTTTTPIDKYIPSVDATVYANGNPASDATPSTENLTGVQAATWSTTDHSASAAATGTDSGGGG